MDIKNQAKAVLEHSTVIANFVREANKIIGKTRCVVYGEGIEFVFSKDDINDKTYIPDAFIACNFKFRTSNKSMTPPRMIMEVLSPSTEKYDREVKLPLYLKAGVSEVWLVSWEKKIVEIYMLNEVTEEPFLYMTITKENKEELRIVSFPDASIDFDELFNMSILGLE